MADVTRRKKARNTTPKKTLIEPFRKTFIRPRLKVPNDRM